MVPESCYVKSEVNGRITSEVSGRGKGEGKGKGNGIS